MDRKPLISVIVPVYKVEDYLGRCVDSLLNQTYENLEIILVDDGSPDGSGKICDAYAERDGRVRVIHKENGGLSSARNAGLDIAGGEYVGFVDSDDWMDEHTYEWFMDMMLQEDLKLVCAGRYDYSSWTGEKKWVFALPNGKLFPARKWQEGSLPGTMWIPRRETNCTTDPCSGICGIRLVLSARIFLSPTGRR